MIIQEMIGKLFSEVKQEDEETLVFKSETLTIEFFHDKDCCESVEIVQVDGDYRDLEDSPILMAEFEFDDSASKSRSGNDCQTWTFYKFATTKGYVTVRWLGESNGYYSERVAVSINDERNYEYG